MYIYVNRQACCKHNENYSHSQSSKRFEGVDCSFYINVSLRRSCLLTFFSTKILAKETQLPENLLYPFELNMQKVIFRALRDPRKIWMRQPSLMYLTVTTYRNVRSEPIRYFVIVMIPTKRNTYKRKRKVYHLLATDKYP